MINSLVNNNIALQSNSGGGGGRGCVNYFQALFYVKTVYVSGVRYWETLHLCTSSCILAHCMLNRNFFVRLLNYLFFSVYHIAHRTT